MGCGISKSVQTVTYAHVPPHKRGLDQAARGAQVQRNHNVTSGNLNNNTNATKNQEHDGKIASTQAVVKTPIVKDYVDIYREKAERSSWSSDDDLSEIKSYGDTRSIMTSRTLLTLTQSAASRRTKSTYLDRELSHTRYDPTYDAAGTLISPQPEGEVLEECSPHYEVIPELPVRPLAVYGGNHFWWPNKRVLLPDYRRVCEVDQLAAQVRYSPDVASIVGKFQSFCEEEVEVARAIFRWIILNIQLKPEAKFLDEFHPQKVLEEMAGNSFGRSALYKEMCECAGLECEVVPGISKLGHYHPGEASLEKMCSLRTSSVHAWNKIRLGGRWYIVDVSPKANTCDLDIHQCDSMIAEESFLPKPQDFLPTHLPMYALDGALEVDLENQLVGDNVCVDVGVWEEMVTRTTAAHEWGIKPLSHQLGVIETNDNEIWIQFMCPNVMEFHVTISSPNKGCNYEGYTLTYLQEDIVTAYIRFPGPNSYIVKIFASPTYTKPGALGLGCKMAMMYTVNVTGGIIHLPFSKSLEGLWGLTPLLSDTGCRILSTKGAEILAVGGTACVDLRLPTSGLFPNVVCFCKAREEDVNLDGFIYPEREGRLARLHLICPVKGEYILQIKFPIEKSETYNFNLLDLATDDDGCVYAYARFFITCPGSSSETKGFPFFPTTFCGPLASLSKYDISFSNHHGSTLYPQEGVCDFTLHQERPVEIFHDLEGEGGVVPRDSARWIYAERNGYDVTYFVKIPEAGRFKLTLACGENGSEEEEDICVFMIDSPGCYHGDLYPAHSSVWGVTHHFHRLGLCSDWEELSKVEVENGQASFMIRSPPEVSLVPRLYHGNDLNMDLTENRIAYFVKTDVHFNMILPYKGFYKLKVFSKEHLVAMFLLFCDKPMKPLVPYEPFWNTYGKHPAFSLNNLNDLDADDGPFRIASEGKCIITHAIPKGLSVRFMLVHKEIVEKGCVYAELNSNEVSYHIQLQGKGYHRFTCWLISDDGVEEEEDEEEEEEEDRLLFSYLILNQDGVIGSETYPEWPQIWGLNHQGLIYGIKIRGRQSSTVKATKGLATLALSHPEDLEVLYSLENNDLDPREAGHCFFVEHQSDTQRLVSISLPNPGKYALKIWARKHTEEHCVAAGAFLVVAGEAGSQRFPSSNDFYANCKLFEPKINPLSSGNEYFFKLEVPGARRLQLWDGVGQWRAVLEPQEEGSDVISGMVNVGGPKELWVAGLYDPDYRYGNGGFRNLLMYEVV